MIGEIVYSLAGRDSHKYLVVVGEADGLLLLCDGKERPIGRPKKKNARHLKLTGDCLEPNQFETNRSLRKALKIYRANGL